MSGEPSKRVGDYEIVSVLGRGGMGNVFKVRNVLSDRIEAMKILLPDLADGQELADRFRREIKVLASLDHPNIAAFRTALTWDNSLVMIMEYVQGMTLATRVAKGPLPLGEAVDYTQQILAALAYAHARHIVHRDIKPANIMVTTQGVIKLMDFGIARCATDATMTLTGTTLGSLYYMSPEQVKGEPVDERSDIYSLGITLYELVTGKRPFEEGSDYSIMAAQLNKQPKPPTLLRTDLPAGLSDVIMKAVAKEPAQRFQSANEFCEALTGLAISRQLATVAREPVTEATATHGVFTAATKSIPAVAITPEAPPDSPSESPKPHERPTPRFQPKDRPPEKHAVVSIGRTGTPSRGLYMSLGALIVAAVLVAAGLYFPRSHVAHSAAPNTSPNASPRSTGPKSVSPAPIENAPPADSSAQTPATSDANASSQLGAPAGSAAIHGEDKAAEVPANNPSGQQASDKPGVGKRAQGSVRVDRKADASKTTASLVSDATVVSKTMPAESSASGPANAALSNSEAVTTAADPEWIAEHSTLEHQFDLLSSRADAINGSLGALHDSQQAQGFGLRGDVVASQSRMQRYLQRASSALNDRNASDARKYLGLAETEVNNLEKFLGR